MPARTVFTALEETARQYGDAVALYQPSGGKAGRGYRTYSWNEWLRTSAEIALGLRSRGLRKGEIVCVLSETRAEFYLTDVGIMAAGGVAAALYTAYPMPICSVTFNRSSLASCLWKIEDADGVGRGGRGGGRGTAGTRRPDDWRACRGGHA